MSVYNMNSVDDNYDFFDFLDYTVTKVDGDFIFAPPTDYNSQYSAQNMLEPHDGRTGYAKMKFSIQEQIHNLQKKLTPDERRHGLQSEDDLGIHNQHDLDEQYRLVENYIYAAGRLRKNCISLADKMFEEQYGARHRE